MHKPRHHPWSHTNIHASTQWLDWKKEHKNSQYGQKHAEAKEPATWVLGEVVFMGAYILKWFPIEILMNKVLEEDCLGRKPSVYHLKLLRSMCYKDILDAKRRKLENKNKLMPLVGYHNIWAYRLFDPNTK